jgi:hypothetical protein
MRLRSRGVYVSGHLSEILYTLVFGPGGFARRWAGARAFSRQVENIA